MQHKVVHRCQEETEINILKPQIFVIVSRLIYFLTFSELQLQSFKIITDVGRLLWYFGVLNPAGVCFNRTTALKPLIISLRT